MQHDLQDEPESTLGTKPDELHPHDAPKYSARAEDEEKPFARGQARHEEAEESEVGDEIRAHDEEDVDRDGEELSL